MDFQFTPHDVWDWHSNQVPALVDGEFAGRPCKLMLWPHRNAFFYVLDRVTGEFLLAEPFSKQTWAKGISESGARSNGSTVFPKGTAPASYQPPVAWFLAVAKTAPSLLWTPVPAKSCGRRN